MIIGINQNSYISFFVVLFLNILFIYFFRQRGRKGEREGDKHQYARETLISRLLHAPPQPGTWPATQACALTENLTSDQPSPCGRTPNTLSHTSQGSFSFLNNCVGEEQTFLYPQGSFGWSSNQIDVRRTSKRK